MISVYFVYYDHRGDRRERLISDAATSLQEARHIGVDFLYTYNKIEKTETPLITRSWLDRDKAVWIDYGSWSEFLKITGVTVEDITYD